MELQLIHRFFTKCVTITHGVVKFYELGVALDVPMAELDTIKTNHTNDVSTARIKLLDYWVKNDPGASWSKLAGALLDIGCRDISSYIYNQYVYDESHVKNTGEINKMKTPGEEDSHIKKNETVAKKANERKDIEEMIYELEETFYFMVESVHDKVNSDKSEIAKFRKKVEIALPHRLRGLKEHIDYNSIKDGDVSAFFEELDNVWNFIDYELLSFIIKRCGTVELKDKMKAYEDNVETFCEDVTIYELITHWKPRIVDDAIPENFRSCVTELSWDPKTSKVKDLKIIQGKMRKIIPQELAVAAFTICKIKISSVIVSWLFHRDCLYHILKSFKISIRNSPSFFPLSKVVMFSLNGVQLYSALHGHLEIYAASEEEAGLSALMDAIIIENVEAIKILLEKNVVLENTSERKHLILASPLMLASYKGHSEVVKVLLAKSAEVDLTNERGQTALMVASQNGHRDIVQTLLENGALIDLQDEQGWCPLMFASSRGHKDVVELLIETGAEVNLLNNNGCSALMIASKKGHGEVVQILQDNGARENLKDECGWSALIFACQSGHGEVVQILLRNGAQVDLPDENGWSPLMFSSQSGRVEIVQILIDNSAQVDFQSKNGCTALMLACQSGHSDVARLLLENGAQGNLQNSLMSSCQNGHIEVVRILLDYGAKINVQDEYGWSPLMSVSQRGHFEVVKLLLENGAQVDLQNMTNQTALMLACQHGHHKAVETLLDFGVQVDFENKYGQTALIYASLTDNSEIVKLLLDSGAELNIQKAFLSASQKGYDEVARMFDEYELDMGNEFFESDSFLVVL